MDLSVIILIVLVYAGPVLFLIYGIVRVKEAYGYKHCSDSCVSCSDCSKCTNKHSPRSIYLKIAQSNLQPYAKAKKLKKAIKREMKYKSTYFDIAWEEATLLVAVYRESEKTLDNNFITTFVILYHILGSPNPSDLGKALAGVAYYAHNDSFGTDAIEISKLFSNAVIDKTSLKEAFQRNVRWVMKEKHIDPAPLFPKYEEYLCEVNN